MRRKHSIRRPFVRFAAVAVAFVLFVVAVQDAGVSHARARSEAIAGNTTIQSFNKARKLMRQVFTGHEQTFYCGCVYSENTVDIQSCGYQPQKSSKRAQQLEWEHVVPAESFGQSFKGRHYAGKVAVPFRFMEADLYNLQPAIGEVNRLRLNYSMAMIPDEAHVFGRCDLEIEDRKIEPRPNIRGDIARTYFYMNAAYPGRGIVSEKNQQLFEAWDTEDSVDDWERERVRRIEQL